MSFMPVVAEVITESVFPEKELEIYIQNSLQKLSVSLQKCEFVASRLIDSLYSVPAILMVNTVKPQIILRCSGRIFLIFMISITDMATALFLSPANYRGPDSEMEESLATASAVAPHRVEPVQYDLNPSATKKTV